MAGLEVHVAARVMAAADDGAVVTSAIVRDLVTGSGIAFSPLGERRLKGVPGSWTLYRVISVPGQDPLPLPPSEAADTGTR